jgi:hypothetical protein
MLLLMSSMNVDEREKTGAWRESGLLRHTSHVTRHTSHVTRHTSHVTRHTSHVTRHTSHDTRHTSHVTRHTSHVTRHTPHVTRHTSHFTRHTSHVTRHTSHVTRHTSHVTRHTSHITHFALLCPPDVNVTGPVHNMKRAEPCTNVARMQHKRNRAHATCGVNMSNTESTKHALLAWVSALLRNNEHGYLNHGWTFHNQRPTFSRHHVPAICSVSTPLSLRTRGT